MIVEHAILIAYTIHPIYKNPSAFIHMKFYTHFKYPIHAQTVIQFTKLANLPIIIYVYIFVSQILIFSQFQMTWLF